VGDAQPLWTSCQAALRDQVSDVVWRSTFQDISEIAVEHGLLRLAVPNSMVKEKIEGPYLSLVQNAVRDTYGPDLTVSLEVRPNAGASSTVADLFDERVGARPTEVTTPTVPAGAALASDRDDRGPGGLDNAPVTRTFDDFVRGPSNQFAHAAALSVAGQPGRSYNPLFIYGDAGLGKTHLLQAIKHYVEENYRDYVVRYVTSETFLNEFIESIRLNTSAEFKRRYREVDVLLVDDIQFLENRKETQEEFFHTFNALHEGRRQLVLSSDRPPDAISTLENRLRSRFKMGLITDIQPPDLETRLAVLGKKAENEGFPVPDDVLEFMAVNITDNIRELEGALNRVSALAKLHKRPITLPEAEQHLHDIIGDRQPRPITPDLILQATSDMFGFTIEEIKGKSRQRPLVTARQIAMYVFRDSTDLSYPAIAREFGGRDHTTVIHAVEKIKALMGERRQIYDQVTELLNQIRKGS
jgi:chromosomal replication initiator protein